MQGVYQHIESSVMKSYPGRKPIKVKVCGMVDPQNLSEICALEPDFVGYIFVPGSPRFVGEHPDPSLFRIPGDRTAKVGVFVNEDTSEVIRRFEQCQLDLVQLHGKEPAHYCRNLVDQGIPVIKAFHPENPIHAADTGSTGIGMDQYSQVAHYLLLDSGVSGEGGTGHKLNWERLQSMAIPLPFLLGGGIGPDDAGLVKAVDHPLFFGVDVNSRFESAPGMKDADLISRFMNELRR
jgi:phosphoribosylanthranilate isomerase